MLFLFNNFSIFLDLQFKRGFRTDSIREYELPSEIVKREEVETKYQKLMRLKFEVNSFIKELEEEEKSNKEERKEGKEEEEKVTPVFVKQEMLDLYSKLENLTNDEQKKEILFPKYEKERFVVLKNNLSSHVLSKIGEIENVEKNSENVEKKNSNITFEIYHNPSKQDFQEKSFSEQLEKRISFVESTIGKNNDLLHFPNENLWSLVDKLHSKISLLDEKKIDVLSNQIKRTNEMVGQLLSDSKSSSSSSSVTITDKINKIFDLMNKWDHFADTVPSIVLRLKELRFIHEQTVGHATDLQQVQSEQSQFNQLLVSHRNLISNMENSLKENAKLIRSNTESLENRISQLQEKLNKK